MGKLAKIIILCLLFTTLGNITLGQEEEELTLYARSAVLLDADLGRILYGKNPQERLSMASTTKIMTCIIALEYGNLAKQCVVSSYAASQPKVRMGVQAEEQYLLEDLLYALMLESYNDVAVVIAENVAGSVEAFAVLMNQKAKELGCENTNFVTPNGLDADLHYTTAYELGLIMRYCAYQSSKKEEFLKVTGTLHYNLSNTSKTRQFSCENHNRLLTTMDGAISGKTGFTGTAGYCYVAAVEQEGKHFIVVLLACGWPNNRSYKWTDTRTLINYGREQFTYVTTKQPENELPLTVIEGKPATEDYYTSPVVNVSWPSYSKSQVLLKNGERLTRQLSLPDSLNAPVAQGQVVGTVRYVIGDTVLEEYEIVVTKTIEKRGFWDSFSYIFRQWSGSVK